MLETPSEDFLELIAEGDFIDNNAVDAACVKRLLALCDMYGTEGIVAKEMLNNIIHLFDIVMW